MGPNLAQIRRFETNLARLGPGPGRPWEHPASPGDYPGFVGPSWSARRLSRGIVVLLGRGLVVLGRGLVVSLVMLGRGLVILCSCSAGYCTGLMLVFSCYSVGIVCWIVFGWPAFLTPLRSSREIGWVSLLHWEGHHAKA